ncbi:hypothetical protein COOONC_11878, partial [Cooperia oncophora]
VVPHPIAYETSLRHPANPQNADALINDSVTTTTTIEVFRTPGCGSAPPPVPSVDDRPVLLREKNVNGPGYESGPVKGQKPPSTIAPVKVLKQCMERRVQVERDVLKHQQGRGNVYDPYAGERSPFANAVTSPLPSSSSTVPTSNRESSLMSGCYRALRAELHISLSLQRSSQQFLTQ